MTGIIALFIELTTTKEVKVAVNVCHISAIQDFDTHRNVYITGSDEPFVVKETIREIYELANKRINYGK